MLTKEELRRYIQKLETDLDLPSLALDQAGVYRLDLQSGGQATIEATDEGVLFFSVLGEWPRQKEENFLLEALKANLFGQTTYGATLGLNEEERLLTLSYLIDYNIDYKEFNDILEDFLNAAEFWKQETLNYKK